MEGRGPYRIYDPGGSAPAAQAPPGEAAAALERLVEENSRLKEKMQGIRMLGDLLGESQMEASRLRQKAEDLVRDSEAPSAAAPASPPAGQLAAGLSGTDTPGPAPASTPTPASGQPEPGLKPPSSATSSEFELVPTEEPASPPESGVPSGVTTEPGPRALLRHLQRLETRLSQCAEEPDRGQLFAHLGRMALEFGRLAAQVQRNEQRTSLLQSLCEQLRKENEALKAKLDKGLEQRDQAAQRLREENVELKKLLMGSAGEGAPPRPGAARKGPDGQRQDMAPSAKVHETTPVGVTEKKVKMLEQQRSELLEVNKQWDQHFRSMKQQCEQKITELRQKQAELQRQVVDLEAEREQRQRDFDRKLLLAKSKIEMEETGKEQLTAEAKELRQKVKHLQDQLSPLARQRDYQDREIQRLNKALEEALNVQGSAVSPPAGLGSAEAAGGSSPRWQELLTQNELLKQQVKIFEEDFQRERSDRERMNEEKEELRTQVERLQAQLSQANAQLKALKEEEKAKDALRQQKRKGKAPTECCHADPHLEHLCGAYPYAYPPMAAMAPPHGFDDWSQIRYPPPAVAGPPLPGPHLFHLPEYAWRPPCAGPRHPASPPLEPPAARPAGPESPRADGEGPQ